MESKIYPIEIKNVLIEDKWIIKRMQELHRDYLIDVSSLALKVIRIGSVEIVKELFNLGLDPSYVDQNNRTTLSTAINRKKSKILELYFNHPKMNRYILNELGENIAFSCVNYRNWKFLEKIIEVEPNLLLTFSTKNKSIFDLLGKDLNGKEIFSIIPNSLKDKLIKVMDYMHETGYYLPIPEKGNEVIEFVVSHNYSRLQNSITDKAETKGSIIKI